MIYITLGAGTSFSQDSLNSDIHIETSFDSHDEVNAFLEYIKNNESEFSCLIKIDSTVDSVTIKVPHDSRAQLIDVLLIVNSYIKFTFNIDRLKFILASFFDMDYQTFIPRITPGIDIESALKELMKCASVSCGQKIDKITQTIIYRTLIHNFGFEKTLHAIHELRKDVNFTFWRWSFDLLAKTYQNIENNVEDMTEEEFCSLIRCYSYVDKEDPAYHTAQQYIYDQIMMVPIEKLTSETQTYLYGEQYKAVVKLGDQNLARLLLPSLCGYGYGYFPFPPMEQLIPMRKGLNQVTTDTLLNQIVAMAEHIRILNEQIKQLKPSVDTARDDEDNESNYHRTPGFFGT